jgi:hypothetical protein
MIRSEIIRQGNAIFTGKEERQVTGFFRRKGEDIKVVDVSTAVLAIDTIVEQGEGTPKGPADLQNDVAHFYSFQELEKAMTLVPDPLSPFGYSAQPISIDDKNDVTPMVDDPQNVTFDPNDGDATRLADEMPSTPKLSIPCTRVSMATKISCSTSTRRCAILGR